LLEETLRADLSISRLQKELSLKAALLEMERIYLVVEAELRSSSTLTDQLLPMVERYGSVESTLRGMVALVRFSLLSCWGGPRAYIYVYVYVYI